MLDMLARVAADIATITGKDFARPITIIPPGDDIEPYIVMGYVGKHLAILTERGGGFSQGFTTVNLNKSYVGFAESALIAAGLTTRDADNNLLNFEKYLISWEDVGGQTKQYIIQQGGSQPDQTAGYLKFTLGAYKASLT